MIFYLKSQRLLGNSGKSIIKVAFRIIMNTKIHVILDILTNSFKMGKSILKDWKSIHMEVRGSSSSFTKK